MAFGRTKKTRHNILNNSIDNNIDNNLNINDNYQYPKKTTTVYPKEKFYFIKPSFQEFPFKINKDQKPTDKVKQINKFYHDLFFQIEKINKDFLILKLFKYCAKKDENYNIEFIKIDKYLNRLKFDYNLIDKFTSVLYKKEDITEDEIDQLYNKVIYVCDFISGVTNDIKNLKKNYYREFKIPSLLTIQDKNSKELEDIIVEVDNEIKKYKSISEAYDYFVYNSGDLLFNMVDELLLIKKTGIKIDRHYFLATDAILLFDYAEWVDLISRIKFVLGRVKGKTEINQKFLELYGIVEIRYIILSIYKESLNK